LRPFTTFRPKVMVPVGNRPILEYVIDALVRNGITDIVLVVGHRKEGIMCHFKDGKGFGATLSYAIQGKQVGTAHALLSAKDYLEDEFLVVAGDNLIDDRSIRDLLTMEGMAVLVTESEIPSKYGVVSTEGDRVASIVEKPKGEVGNTISTGIYRFTSDLIPLLEEQVAQGVTGLTTVLQTVLSKMSIRAVKTDGRWIDAVYPWDLIKVNTYALDVKGQEIAGKVEAGVTIKGAVHIGRGTRIRSGCYIEGPVSIGEGCDIGPNVTIFPTTSIGHEVQIEPYVLIANSILMNGVKVGSHSHLSYSVIDEGVTTGPNVMAASLAGYTRMDDKLYRLDEMGALVGPASTLGSGVVISPGIIIGAECRVSDGVKVSRNIDDRSEVI
jgi:UDP-N-acetylglucosamine diphosphorylase/glucosamine-1-phosphate N-acetyltransferase